MAKLQNLNGRYCESEFEYAFLSFLEDEGWNYLLGKDTKKITKYGVVGKKPTTPCARNHLL